MRCLRILLVVFFVAGACRSLDRTQKTACRTGADCVKGATCEGNVCVMQTTPGFGDITGTGDTAGTSSGSCEMCNDYTGTLQCLQSDTLCDAQSFCDNGKCAAFVERDYAATKLAFEEMLCQSLEKVCGADVVKARLGDKPTGSCRSLLAGTGWDIGLGPDGAVVDSWDAHDAARCVAGAGHMLLEGFKPPFLAELPEACAKMGGHFNYEGLCPGGQAECGAFNVCASIPTAQGVRATCASVYHDFGESCSLASAASAAICKSGLYCDLSAGNTCKKRLQKGDACALFDPQCSDGADPTCARFDPCDTGLMCAGGHCQAYAPRCPLTPATEATP